MTDLVWLRRDLRLRDNAALAAAGDSPALLFVIDPVLWACVGPIRRAWLGASLRALEAPLILRLGDPAVEVAHVATSLNASRVHVAREFTPYAVRRDRAVATSLRDGGVEPVVTGSAYAVDPGTLTTKSDTAFKVFTPFSRPWLESAAEVVQCEMVDIPPQPRPFRTGLSEEAAWHEVDRAIAECPIDLPPAGEEAAHARWRTFLDEGLKAYDTARDLPGADGTSFMSPYLRLGVVHPTTLLHDLRDREDEAAHRFRLELAWREFYADVLWNNPDSAWADLNRLGVAYDEPGPEFEAWQRGETGFPIVDAGMRQLAKTGWMHNRVPMITASFLPKDLHVWWPHGARHFLDLLLDGDLASNNHGWQWVAGTGTDASPYFRVFNPVTQGLKFDPHGAYVRRWVPELADLPGKTAHEPWKYGGAPGYPDPIVDHASERTEALRRYQARVT